MRRAAIMLLGGLTAGTVATVAPAVAAAQDTHLVVIVGVGGDEEHRDRFHDWAVTLVDTASERFGLPADRVHYLGERVERDPDRIEARSSMDDIQATLRDIAVTAAPSDTLVIVLIGHGSSDESGPKFNVPGRDPTAFDFGVLLEGFPSQRIVFVNAATASGEFVAALSGPRRTIVTATKTGRERNDSLFGGYFVAAFGGDGDSDLDKDGRVSVLEAYTYARRQVAQAYENDGLLLTEHALLDDNGDGEGSHEPDPEEADGAIARTLFLEPRPGEDAARSVAVAGSPELQSLYAERIALEERIDMLRASRSGLDPADYDRQLETLMIDLARASRAIRELEDKTP
jgi:hypothetical protein